MRNANKLMAVAKVKWLCISQNMTIMLGPIMVVAVTWGLKLLYSSKAGGELAPELMGFVLSLGISMNLCSDGFVMVGTSIAEEKEKHTLRALMTSSITGMQYFIGSILFPFFMLMAVQLVIPLICGIPLGLPSMPLYFFISAIASLISCVIGMIVGICAKNQVGASLISYPLMIVLMMVPVFGNLSGALEKISAFLFTGVVTEMAECIGRGEAYAIKPLDVAVLLGELIISVLLFLMFYRKNGYEKD